MKEVFEQIWKSNRWARSGKYPKAGAGSTKKYCKDLLEKLEPLVGERVFIDLGCNDKKNWLPEAFTESERYFGIDIVEDCGPNLVCNILEIEEWKRHIPEGPKFFFIKDVLQHWETSEVETWMEQIIGSLEEDDVLCTINAVSDSEERSFKKQYAPIKYGRKPFHHDYGAKVEQVLQDWKPRRREVLIWRKVKA